MVARLRITHRGITKTITEWSEATGLNYYTIADRLRRGWSAEEALATRPLHRSQGSPSHGMTYTKEYAAWLCMKRRCSDSKRHNAHRYLGRGISVCKEWRESFEAFFSHVGPAPSPKHSLDRIDNDRGYFPGNVRWATAREQARNRTRSVKSNALM